MATLGDLKSRIMAETNRDDLADDLASTLSQVISSAISDYADMRFYFNEARAAVPVATGVEYLARPMRVIDNVYVQLTASSRYLLMKQDVDAIELWAGTPVTGQPTDYAAFQDKLRLYPVPNTAYTLSVLGVADEPALIADTDANHWTNEGQDLICARAQVRLYRDVFRDPDGAQLATAAEAMALRNLKGETGARLGTGRTRVRW